MGATAILGIVATAFGAIKTGGEIADTVGKTYNDTKLLRTNGSLTKLLSEFIIEPVAIVSDDLRNEDNIDKILELNTDIFSSYYVQAFDVLTKIHGIDAKVAINIMSTDVLDYSGLLKAGYKLSGESRDYAGELFDDSTPLLSCEDMSEAEENTKYLRDKGRKLAETNSQTVLDHQKSKTTIAENKNLPAMVMRNIDLEIMATSPDGKKYIISIPVVIKLHVIYVKNSQILNMMEPNADDKRFGSRVDDYRSGAISLKELVFASDLIAKYKQNKIKDESELLSIISSRTMSANMKAINKSAIGFEKYYNLLVLSNAAKAMLEKSIKGSIGKPKYKEKLMEQTKSLLVTVVDTDYERITIHTKDIAGTTDITFKSLSKKSKDTDLSEIFKALVANRPPVL